MTEFQPQQSGIEKKPKMTKEATVLIERKQKLNPENIDVVRVLLTQPISSTDINDMDTTDLYNISFMRSVLSKKSEGASNPGQLMPVGGNIDDGDYAKANSTNELLLIAAHRELMEETHLKASKMEVLDTIQDYSFMHRAKNQQEGGAKKSEMNRKVKFVSATLLSHRFDRPYPLDIEEDKIKGFRRFDYNQFSKLLKEGTIETDGSNLIILDSLISSAEKRKKLVNGSNTKTRPEIVKKVHKEILQSMEESEFNKKKKILLMLNKLGKIKIPKEKDLLTSINKIQNSAKKLEKINTLWSNIINMENNEIKWQDVREALMIDNYKEYTDYIEYIEKNGHSQKNELKEYMIPTVYLLYPLFFGMSDRVPEIVRREIIKCEKKGFFAKNSSEIFDKATILYYLNNYLNENNKNPGKYLRGLKLLHWKITGKKINYNKKVKYTDEEIISITSESFLDNLDIGKLEQITGDIDTWFTDLQLTLNHKINKSSNVSISDHSIFGLKIHELLKYAFMKIENPNQPNGDNNKERLIFEAQRKLILVLIFSEAYKYRNNVLQIGIKELDSIEESILGINKDNKQENNFKLNNKWSGQRITNVKELYSFGRKIIERDILDFEEEGKDIFRESLIFNKDGFDKDKNGKINLQIQKSLPIPEESFVNTNEKFLDNPEIPLCIYKYMKYMYIKAEKENKKLTIHEWKPYTGKMNSTSAAGGGDIRLWKFYIEIKYTSDYGGDKTEKKEVQCYLPNVVNSEIVGGEHDNIIKKADDKRYGLERLLTSNSARSIVELLWPVAVYGEEIKALFSKSNNK